MPTAKSYSQATNSTDWNPVKRSKPRLVVRRGYPGNETSALSRSLPTDVAIKSGQIVTESSGKWILAVGNIPAGKGYIAYHDSSDPDVVSSGQLLAFDLNGEFEFESGYYSDGGNGTIADGTALVVGTTAGELVPNGSTEDGGGAVLGYVRGAEVDLADGQYSTSVNNMAQDTQASAANSVVVRFVTA